GALRPGRAAGERGGRRRLPGGADPRAVGGAGGTRELRPADEPVHLSRLSAAQTGRAGAADPRDRARQAELRLLRIATSDSAHIGYNGVRPRPPLAGGGAGDHQAPRRVLTWDAGDTPGALREISTPRRADGRGSRQRLEGLKWRSRHSPRRS